VQVEDKLIGIDHARVGGLIAERWGFPNALVDAISYHHYPSLARTNAVLPAIVNLANSVTAAIDQPDAILLGGEVPPRNHEHPAYFRRPHGQLPRKTGRRLKHRGRVNDRKRSAGYFSG
jgi:hypothetical protein